MPKITNELKHVFVLTTTNFWRSSGSLGIVCVLGVAKTPEKAKNLHDRLHKLQYAHDDHQFCDYCRTPWNHLGKNVDHDGALVHYGIAEFSLH